MTAPAQGKRASAFSSHRIDLGFEPAFPQIRLRETVRGTSGEDLIDELSLRAGLHQLRAYPEFAR